MRKLIFILALVIATNLAAQQYMDKPYLQDQADKYELNQAVKNSVLLHAGADRNLAIKVLSSEGLLNAFDHELTTDFQYRPVTDMKLKGMTVYKDQFVYLTDRSVFSNAWAGKFDVAHGVVHPTNFAMGSDFMVLVGGNDEVALLKDGKKIWSEQHVDLNPKSMVFDEKGGRFLILSEKAIYEVSAAVPSVKSVLEQSGLTALAVFKDQLVVGTGDGIFRLSGPSHTKSELDQKLPWTEITAIKIINDQLWFGSTKGAFALREDGKFDYYASKRWLVDDAVIDIAAGPGHSVLITTKTGVSQIDFKPMTLAEKADYFQKIQRLRHIRYGFTANLS
ncbi:MAG: hypothetical protein WBM83_02720, partial [Flavobacteriaceae bacterium]